jgi:integrase/recombinase XerD
MNSSKPNALGRMLRSFFADHLPRVRGSSPHTILSYRDTLVLFLRFVADRCKRSVSQLDLGDFDPPEVLAFLEHLETTRHNLVATRNVRLAAIHAFFRYCATADPTRVEPCQRVLAIPFKRTGSSPIHYLEYDEIQAVLGSIGRTTADGRRDYVLLAIMFNTGARVQEIVTLCVRDLQLEALPQVRLFGKGRKERWCPLWPQTAELLRAWLRESGCETSPDRPLFCNHRGDRLTRFGVRYLLRKYCARAKVTTPSLGRKRLHPHSMRHSSAVHLLRSGVEITTISQWLGHASVATTNRYATVDLEMKRKAIEQARPTNFGSDGPAQWRTDASILDWLEGL